MKTYNKNADMREIAATLKQQIATGAYRRYIDESHMPTTRAEFTIGTLKLRCTDSPEAIQALLRKVSKQAPGANTKPKNMVWCVKAIAKRHNIASLSFMKVTDTQMVCSDGKRIHCAPNVDHMPPGMYRKTGENAEGYCDVADYPDMRALFMPPATVAYNPKLVVLGNHGEIATATYNDAIAVNYAYLKDALSGMKTPNIIYGENPKNGFPCMQLECPITGACALIMGLRIDTTNEN